MHGSCHAVIKATTTLYGVVSMQKIVEIYNEQNDDAITLDNLKDYSVEGLEKEHVYAEGTYFALCAIEDIAIMLKVQGSAPYYVPNKTELLKYADGPPYGELEQYKTLFAFLEKHHGPTSAEQFCNDIYGIGLEPTLEQVRKALYAADITLTSREQLDELLQLVVDLANHMRNWLYRGHTRSEMEKSELITVDDLRIKDYLSARKHTRIILWVVIIFLWLSMRNMAMAVVSAVLFVLDGVVLSFRLFRFSDELLEQDFLQGDQEVYRQFRGEQSANNLKRLLRFLEIMGYMLLGAAVWARFFG